MTDCCLLLLLVAMGARGASLLSFRGSCVPLQYVSKRLTLMVRTAMLYLDDSGTRHPDRRANGEERRFDWFALGGVIVNDDEYSDARSLVDDFRSRWPQLGATPLHSWEIRNSAKNFT